jgi:hypothetical protein
VIVKATGIDAGTGARFARQGIASVVVSLIGIGGPPRG